MARPSSYNEVIGDAVCEILAEGRPVREAAEALGISSTTIFKWAHDIPEFTAKYARAKMIACDHMFEQMVDIADNGSNDWMEKNDPNNPGYIANGEHTQRSKLRLDARKWYLSKLAPKKYGDKVAVEHEISDTVADRIIAARKRARAKDEEE